MGEMDLDDADAAVDPADPEFADIEIKLIDGGTWSVMCMEQTSAGHCDAWHAALGGQVRDLRQPA